MRSLALALVVVLGHASAAHAQPRDSRTDASELFARGQTAQAEGRYRDAITAYEQAYALVPHAYALYNIAVCYERLEDWQAAADNYERYLARDPSAADAGEVRTKIRELRAKQAAAVEPPAPVEPWPTPQGTVPPPHELVGPPAPRPEPTFHVGLSYGLGFGDYPVHRYLAHVGKRFAKRVEISAVLGGFGKNDHGLGAMGRLLLSRQELVAPFVHAAATVGYAKQDGSASAETRIPFGVELGIGARLGRAGRIEADLVVRWVANGWDAESTTADSFVNDTVAIGIDVGFAFDYPFAPALATWARR